MKGTLTAVLALLILGASATDSNAQFRQNSAFQLGVKLGASSYSGDVGPAPPGTAAFDATYEIEGFYRFNRWLNVGIRHSTGSYPALGGTSDRRHSTSIGLRSYVLKGRFSPYLQLGVSRSYGGEMVGMGLSTAAGAEIAISSRLALFQEVSFDSVFPDEAVDGSIGGTSFDLLGRIGVGMRFTFGKNPKKLRIDRIEFPATIEAGKSVRFSAVVSNAADGAQFEWDLPGGAVYAQNPVDHVFEAPGKYEFDVVVKGENGRAMKRVKIEVAPSSEAVAAAAADSAARVARIEAVYGPRVTIAGTQSVYRVKIADGGARPVEYTWLMGDGGIAEGNNVSYQFDEPGTYAITAVVRNEAGSDTTTIAVLVDPSPEASSDAIADVGEHIDTQRNTGVDESSAEEQRLAAERAEAERRLAEVRAEEERLVQIRAEQEKAAAEKAAADLAAAEKAAADRAAAEKAAADRAAAEKAAADRAAAEKAAADRAAAEKAAADLAAAEQAAADKAAAEKAAADLAAAEKAAADQAAAEKEQADAAQTIAEKIAAAANTEEPTLTTQAPPVPGIDWSVGGYTWVVESASSRNAAQSRTSEYSSLGFPVGVYRDTYNGKTEYHVVVGQSASQRVAERIGVRIQRHVPRRIWLLDLNK